MLDLFPSREAGPFGRRLKRERGAKIPVTVVTGFLGSGKTTLLQRFLSSPEGQGTAVIINEFGAVGIDDVLVRDSAEETVLLGNGCVCCITRTDLQAALRRLVFDREHGVVPPFRRIVIETSGLADPGPILQTFSTDRALGGEFHIDQVLTVVDANTGLAICDPTVRMQAASLDGAMFVDAEPTQCGPTISSCPPANPEDDAASTDAGFSPCVYALEALNGVWSPTMIEVAKPGYVTAPFFDISGGFEACGQVASIASRSVVSLVPIAPDAATDGP